jgi:ABC-type glycerol-3-phosphate transport system substrate-binding protein
VKRAISTILMATMIAAGLGILVFGPRPKVGGAGARVHIQYWDKWTGLEGDQMREIVDEFNNTVGKQDGIYVDFVSMSQIDRKTLISTAGGVPPDVAGLWDTQVLQFASMNALEPLDTYAQRYGMTRDKYKPVFYDGCQYQGKLYAIPSTVWCIAMLWNKAIFEEKSSEIRAAGLDPDQPPKTIAELDKYSAAIDTWDKKGNHRLASAGLIPLEPGTATNEMGYWFGATIADPTGTRMLINSPEMMATYNWIRGYSERIGGIQIAEFRSGFNSGGISLFDTPQNPFLVGSIAIEAQGPWISAFIEKYDPAFDRWHVPADQVKRESDFPKIQTGMTRGQVEAILGPGDAPSNGAATPLAIVPGHDLVHWSAGIKDIYITFSDDKVVDAQARLLPAEMRKKFCQWGAAAFPSGVPGKNNITYAGMDVWVVPSTSKHKKEAFEFIAFASRQAQIEKLSSLHCNLSPLKDESREYIENHPNPYVDVYEKLAASPNAMGLPRVVNWPQIYDELTQAAERSYLMQGSTTDILDEIQVRCQKELNKALDVPEDTNLGPDNVSLGGASLEGATP